jgi:hypothetical protein
MSKGSVRKEFRDDVVCDVRHDLWYQIGEVTTKRSDELKATRGMTWKGRIAQERTMFGPTSTSESREGCGVVVMGDIMM